MSQTNHTELFTLPTGILAIFAKLSFHNIISLEKRGTGVEPVSSGTLRQPGTGDLPTFQPDIRHCPVWPRGESQTITSFLACESL